MDLNVCIDVEQYVKKEKIGINLKNNQESYLYDLELVEKIKSSPTSFVFVFEYPEEIRDVVEVDIFSAFMFIGTHDTPSIPGTWNGIVLDEEDHQVKRKYTPIYIDVDKRLVHFLIRIYSPTDLYPDGGKFTRYLDKFLPTETITFMPLKQKYKLITDNTIKALGKRIEFDTLNIAAGGTGITPFIRLLNYYQDLPYDINLIYCNRSVEEIMLKGLFDKLASINKRLKITYLASSGVPSEDLVITRITEEIVSKKFINTEKAVCLFCGPPGFNDLFDNLNRFVAKAIVLSKLVKLRLAQPMLKGSVEDSNKSLSVSVKAVSFLTKIVPILKLAQALSNKSLVSSTVSKGTKKVGTVRLHNKEEQIWRVLRPGYEKQTKHLRWRK
ncbi:NADH-cytochrome b5 reductase, putative [Theileria annulata]|uniref:NADH-cytochrome b5 reductase, putative n=1 Tax=Theileria annulata TaxID=5874 RepID=Q4UEP8_THEAN|nr:NADH-cytochrome b5 reductase, putative [Theileria annulata]CAI74441.1 NADH-cytochrome b5 reductase, putative [Theileria annulata]|eukprot:XP_952173.1 NADH-cytochrome b5 reductase, putative [Theileria annulata]